LSTPIRNGPSSATPASGYSLHREAQTQWRFRASQQILTPMSQMGHKRTFTHFRPMSALPPKADIVPRSSTLDCRQKQWGSIPFSQRGTLLEKAEQNQNLILAKGAQGRTSAI
jgi:hypothetical protein